MQPPYGSILAICLGCLLLSSCANRDIHHKLVISVPDQRMILYTDSQQVAEYYVSTSKYGIGDRPGSYATPLGNLEVEKKIGDYVPAGGVLKSRTFTGEVLAPNAPGRDPIVTRILWLKGLDTCNCNAFGRCIYIHGTPEERNIGRPASFGCIRMRSEDIINLYNAIGVGAKVEIINAPFTPPPIPQQVAQLQMGG
jgi:lipoprotein-anchoring transpeptidase ErfK/SrfK